MRSPVPGRETSSACKLCSAARRGPTTISTPTATQVSPMSRGSSADAWGKSLARRLCATSAARSTGGTDERPSSDHRMRRPRGSSGTLSACRSQLAAMASRPVTLKLGFESEDTNACSHQRRTTRSAPTRCVLARPRTAALAPFPHYANMFIMNLFLSAVTHRGLGRPLPEDARSNPGQFRRERDPWAKDIAPQSGPMQPLVVEAMERAARERRSTRRDLVRI